MNFGDAMFEAYEAELSKGFEAFYSQVAPGPKSPIPKPVQYAMKGIARNAWCMGRTEFVVRKPVARGDK